MCACAGAALAAAPDRASAEFIIEPGLYRLGDHPDGNAARPFYGLRLDELINVTGGHDIFTFSFDHVLHEGVEMFLQFNGTDIHIYGIAFGGLIENHDYDPGYSGLVEIDFLYKDAVKDVPDDDLIVFDPDMFNTGSIRFLDGGDPFDLYDKANAEGFTFRLGDENDDNGHRGWDGISGWGWLMHDSIDTYVESSDWLFTLDPTPVPGPSSLALATMGVVMFLRGKPRKR